MKILKEHPSPALELFRVIDSQYQTVKIWACGECGIIHKDENAANDCCRMNTCPCGDKILTPYYTLCTECSKKNAAEREHERLKNMPTLESYNGEPLFDGSYYHTDFEEYLDSHEYWSDGNEDDLDDFLIVCEIKKLGFNINPEDVVQRLREEAYEYLEGGDIGDMDGEDELITAIEKFKESQTREVYEQTNRKIIVKTILNSIYYYGEE